MDDQVSESSFFRRFGREGLLDSGTSIGRKGKALTGKESLDIRRRRNVSVSGVLHRRLSNLKQPLEACPRRFPIKMIVVIEGGPTLQRAYHLLVHL